MPGGSDAAVQSVRAHPLNVVVVDSRPLVADGLARMLAASPDIEIVAIATDAGAVRAAASQLRPDVMVIGVADAQDTALVDERLWDGLDAAVVGVSPVADSDVVERLLDAGLRSIVVASGTPEDLMRAVVEARRERATPRPAPSARPAPRPSVTQVEASLTEREREVLDRLLDGSSTRAIGAAMGISENTVRSHLRHLFRKLGVHTRVEAVAAAHRLGLERAGGADVADPAGPSAP